jgi:alkanesulfonate monooxygenase SsuD/methylene tetrahydromethanopterin reductase-like flavin-dependent oxidoreductase (luciferase family)
MMFSYLRTPEQYEALYAAYRDAGGTGLVAANRPAYVGEDDASAWRDAEPALRSLWRRFQGEGKIARDATEPEAFDSGNVPGQFLVGGPDTVADYLNQLHDRVPFDVINLEPRWPGFTIDQMHANIRRFAEQVAPRLRSSAR